MAELSEMLALWRDARRQSEDLCLVTVVRTEGSSYRKAGARMLLSESGRRAGTISGGCLEAEIQKKAWWLTRSGARVERYSSFFDDNSAMPYGLGCGGTVWVMLERGAAVDAVLAAIKAGAEGNASIAIGSVISEDRSIACGTQIIVDAKGESLIGPGAPTELANLTRSALRDSTSLWQGDPSIYFAEYVAPPRRLFLFGAGDDAQPVAVLASQLGWQVTVLDGRPHLANTLRFPTAHAVGVFNAEGSSAFDALGIHAQDAVVLMTHNYAQDLTLFRHLQGVTAGYIGVLGPLRRTQQLLRDAGASVQHSLVEVHSPAGLNIGASGPAEIALSIVAEVQAVMSKSPSGSARDRSEAKVLSCE